MRRVFLLKGLNCPNCSEKIENDVKQLRGVSSSDINLINQTLTVDFSSDYNGDTIDDIKKIVNKYEPDIEVLSYERYSEHREKLAGDEGNGGIDRPRIFRLSLGAIVYVVGIILAFCAGVNFYIEIGTMLLAYAILGGDILWRAVKNILKGQVFDENFLMSVSSIGAFLIGEYREAVAVMLFYQIGEFFQDIAVQRSRKSISSLMDIRPDSASVKRDGRIVTLSPEKVEVGDIIVVRPGEKIPLDGVIINGESMVDTVALTGESVPHRVKNGDEALSGCINQSGVITIKVTKSFGESTASRIINMVENATSKKAPSERFITKFSRYYTPAVMILALILAVVPPIIFGGDWIDWLKRGLVFLVISCPCALVISIPLAFFGGIGSASRKGILVKGGNYLEVLNSVETVVFDKTGTLTKGVFDVRQVGTANGYTDQQVLRFAAKAESFSNHPIARSIIKKYNKAIDESRLRNYTEFSGRGVSVLSNGVTILAGNGKLMQENNIKYEPCNLTGTIVYIAYDGVYAGYVLISDEIKEDSINAVKGLEKVGIKRSVMLTGDNEEIAKDISTRVGIREYRAGLLPDQKVQAVEVLEGENSKAGKLMFVGDGINDAPVLARADIGVAMGGLGSDAAIEAADVVLMTDEPSKLVDAILVARATKRIVKQNIIFALGVKALFLILGAFGIVGMWEAVFGDVGVMVLAVLNSMRILFMTPKCVKTE